MAVTRLDVRALPTWERHPRIFAAFDTLREGETLTILTDHEPRPLRLEFEQLRPEQFVLAQRQLGEQRWEAVVWRARRDDARDGLGGVFARCAVFARASGETRQALARVAVERALTAKEPLVAQDAHWPYLGIVREGALAAIAGSSGGREQILFEIFPLETFSEIEALDGGRALARIVPTSRVARIVLVPRAVILSLMIDDVVLTRALQTACAQRARSLAGRLVARVTQPTIARVAAAILPYAPPAAGLSPTLPPLRQMSQTRLAIAAGTVKEVVARVIAELEAAGAIQREGGHIARADRAKLVAFLDDAV
jgi:uncharacterized protein (DUF2249 family)/CRP-like cAMP-binding protein